MSKRPARDDKPELDDDPIIPILDDQPGDQIEGEHPDGDYPQDIYDDDPDEPITGPAAVEEEA